MRRCLVAVLAMLVLSVVPSFAEAVPDPVPYLRALQGMVGGMDAMYQLTSGSAGNDQWNHRTIKRTNYTLGYSAQDPCEVELIWVEYDGTYTAAMNLHRAFVSSLLPNATPDSSMLLAGNTAHSTQPMVELVTPTHITTLLNGKPNGDHWVPKWIHGAANRQQADEMYKLWGAAANACRVRGAAAPATAAQGPLWLIERGSKMKMEMGVYYAKWDLLSIDDVEFDPLRCHLDIVYRFRDWRGEPFFKSKEYYLGSTQLIKAEVSSSGTGFVSFDTDLGKRFVTLEGKAALDIGAAFNGMKASCGK